MTGDADKLGSLRGQDLVKFGAMGIVAGGAALVTAAQLWGWPWLAAVMDGLRRLLATE